MARVYKRGSSWVLSYADPREPGRQIRRSLGSCTKLEATTALHALEIQLATGQSLLPQLAVSKALTVKQLSEEYLAWRAQTYPDSQSIIASMHNLHVIPGLGKYDAAKLTPKDIDTWLAEIIKKYKPKSVKAFYDTAKAMYTWAVKRRRILENPFKLVTTPQDVTSRPHRWYSHEELEKIYAADSRYAPIWQLMVNTGLRRKEMVQLKWSDVKATSIHVISEQMARTKSAKWRNVVLLPAAQEALKQLPRTGEYVIPPISPQLLYTRFHNCLIKAGITPPIGSIHSLRHTYCTRLVQQGVPLTAVKVLAGHSSTKITENYAHIDQSYLEGILKEVEI